MMLTTALQDPEQYVILQALQHARGYAITLSPATAARFFEQVATSRRQPHTIMGPAGALQFYLAKLDWQLDRQGHLLIAAFFQLHLTDSNWQGIVARSW